MEEAVILVHARIADLDHLASSGQTRVPHRLKRVVRAPRLYEAGGRHICTFGFPRCHLHRGHLRARHQGHEQRANTRFALLETPPTRFRGLPTADERRRGRPVAELIRRLQLVVPGDFHLQLPPPLHLIFEPRAHRRADLERLGVAAPASSRSS